MRAATLSQALKQRCGRPMTGLGTSTDFSLLAPLRDAYEASRAVRGFADLQRTLDRVACLVTEKLGWERVIIHGHRQAWDRFEVVVARGPDAANRFGEVQTWTEWAPFL